MSDPKNKHLPIKSHSTNNSILHELQEKGIKLLNTPIVVSGRKHVEETYHMLETAVEQSIDGIAVADVNGIIKFCNQSWAQMHGYYVYELLGRHLNMFHTKEQMESDVIPFNEKVKSYGSHSGYVGHVKKDGTIFSTWMTTTLLKDEKGEAIGFVGIAKDITNYKRMQEALRSSELQYRLTLDSMPEAIHVVNKELKLVLFNSFFVNWNKQLGLETNVIGKNIFEIFPFLPDKVKDEYRIVFETGEICATEESIRIKDKSLVTETRKMPILEDGKVAQVVTVIKDITARKKLEERVSKINKCFIGFGLDPDKNISRLVALCGESMGATCALYNRLEHGLLCSIGQWKTPVDYNPLDKPEGHICFDVIKNGSNGLFIVNNLANSKYAQTDPNVIKYSLKTYVGLAVKLGNDCIGSLCVVYQNDFTSSSEDKEFMQIIASAIAVEEKRRLSKEELRKSEKKYKTLTENINVGLYRATFGPEGKFIEANSAFVKMLGYENKEEFLAMDCCDLYQNPEDRDKFSKKMLDMGFVKDEVLLLKKKDGTPIIASVSAVAVKDERWEVKYFDGIVEDITERKLMEEAIRKSEEKYRFLFEEGQAVSLILTRDGIIKDINKASVGNLGYTKEEIIGKKALDFVIADQREFVAKELEKGIKGEKGPAVEACILAKDGSVHTLLFSPEQVLFYEEGRPAGALVTGIDITERKRAEKALKESERFLSDVFESIQDGISVLDMNLTICRVNSVMEKWYANNAPLVGKKCFECYHNYLEPCNPCPTLRCIKSGHTETEIVPGLPGSSTEWLELYSYPIKEENSDKVIGVVEFVRDITERKRVEKKSEALNKELSRSNRRLRQLALRDSHTGLYNHRYLQEAIEVEFSRAKRYSNPLSVIMLDLDYFKSINDVYSHKFGDLVLKQFARKLKRLVRRYDIAIRFGGEEFVIILPETEKQSATTLAHRLLNDIGLCNFGDEENSVKLKLSIAVVSYPEDGLTKGMDLLELVDKILNKVKEDGGDRVYSTADIKDIKKQRKISLRKNNKSSNVRFLKEKIDKLNKRANQSLIESVFAFARTIKLKDQYTGEHVENTVSYATDIAKKLNLSKMEIEFIRRASMVHDLGKIGISEKILLKQSKLTNEEFEDIKRHPQIGADILRPIHFLHDIIPSILYHHERWDGNGYPCGLKKDEIPLGARIVAIADVYQALISDRPYRKAFSKEKAKEIVKEGSGTQFDPGIVEAFLNIIN